MNTFTGASTPLKLFGAVLALALIAVAALVVTPITQAEGTGDTPTPTPTPVVNTYPDPQPCGKGAATAFQPEPHRVTKGHFALFDAYWRASGTSTGVLHTNLCPPLVTETTRTSSGIDIGEAIMHVLDEYKVDVVATNAEATDGQLSLDEYPEVRKALGLLGPNEKKLPVPDGTQVWWLRLDDPDTADKDETSELSLGFSAALFDDEHWLKSSEGKPMRYKFLVERYPADPDNLADVPHFFAYEAPNAKGAEATRVWDSYNPAVEKDDMLLDLGEYRALQWVFTKPGTYLLSVQLQGFVRENNPHAEDDPRHDANWKRISSNETETSEVKQYTIQVGSEFAELEPPLFGVNLSIAENSPGGVKVGDPIPVFGTESTVLKYLLGGAGHDHFELVATTNPHAVQIVVADGARLDYETKASYDLTLAVTNNVDHEDNPDPTVDDTLAVRIDLEDMAPGLSLRADRESLPVGETVNFIAMYEPTPERRGQTFTYQWGEQTQTDGVVKWHAISDAKGPAWSVSQSSPTSKTYRVSAVVVGNNPTPIFVDSNAVEIRWNN